MKQAIRPGESIDVLAPHEFESGLQRMLDALGKNARFRKVTIQSIVQANNVYLDSVGPAAGFLWDCRYAACWMSDALSDLYLYETENQIPINRIINIKSGDPANKNTLPAGTFVIYGGNKLSIGPGAVTPTVGTNITVVIGVVEVPVKHEGQLLG